MSLRNKVVVLNSAYQACGEVTVKQAIGQICVGAATCLNFEGDVYYPVKWEDWILLPVRPGDGKIRTPRMVIRAPTVIIAVNYSKIPRRRPKFNLHTIAARDGFRDAYSGEYLDDPKRWSLDHVTPKSRGGKDVPENTVLCDKTRNNQKGNRLPEELGWKRPKAGPLRPMIPAQLIKATHDDHRHFLIDSGKKNKEST